MSIMYLLIHQSTEEITERKKLEQMLIASENRFHSLADNSLVGTFILTRIIAILISIKGLPKYSVIT